MNSRLATWIKKIVVGKSGSMTVVSRAMREKVIGLGADQHHVHVIPMGVDLKHTFTPSNRQSTGESILFVGRFVEKKGLGYLVDAMPDVLKKHPEAVLSIAGHGPGEHEIRQRVDERGIAENVRFMGALDNRQLPAVYRAADIFVLPSIVDRSGDTEGFGLVTVEALGCGCAVIASDLPAVRDIVLQGETGLLVEQKNAGMLAEKIVHLLDSPDLCRRLADNGRRYVLNRYDWEITAEKYTLLFEGLGK